MLEPYTYITANPGKEIRGKLVEGFNLWLNVPKDKLVVINRVVGLLHNASLLYVPLRFQTELRPLNFDVCRVDDIEDDSQLRRGIPGLSPISDVPSHGY